MASGIRVKRITDPVYKKDGALFLIDLDGARKGLPSGVHVLSKIRPTPEIAVLDRGSTRGYQKFKTLYWRQLGTRSNIEELAKIRELAKKAAGATLLTGEHRPEWSAAMAVAELLDGQNQRPRRAGRSRYGYVYVIELERRSKSNEPVIYVGDTGKSPEERFRDHINNRRSSKCVRGNRGKRLAYELFKHLNPLPGDDACERAKELRQLLLGKYEVCGSPECMEVRSPAP